MAKIDFARLAREAASSSATLVDPRDVFNALAGKAPGYDYLRGPQDQVLQQWYERRTSRDLVIKMNTGGGKTIVGLLIARSCLNEEAGPVAYLVPDNYLVDQVCNEAGRLGIDTTTNPQAFAYSSGRAVLVVVFQRLFNGQSVFGISGSAGRAPVRSRPGTVIIDDAHACLAKAEQEFRLTVPSSEAAYEKIVELFADVVGEQSPTGLLDLRTKRIRAVQQIPFWAWADRQDDVLAQLHPLGDRDPYKFSWPLLVDVLPVCRAVLTTDALEIAAPCLPVSTVIGFQQAKRRIYLTATLADDGVLVTDFAARPDAVADPIVPASAGDIGDRLILTPQQTHPDANPDEIRDLVLELAEHRNVVVIVPSYARAQYWKQYAALVLDKDNLNIGVDQLRSNPALGLAVLVNRYDGVDLPGDACHVLVVDGLPEALDGLERLDQAQLAGSDLLIARQVQRLEQGMGRATRSNEDHCVVLLLGARLAERLHGPGARSCFSPATRAQLDLSSDVAGELEESTDVQDLHEVIDQCLSRDKGWIMASRSRLAALRYEPATVAATTVAQRTAFDSAAAHEYRSAVDALQTAVDAARDPVLKGYLQQQLASYMHHVDPAAAQQTQLSANRTNRNLLRPISGVTYEKLSGPTADQGAAASSWLQSRYPTNTELALGVRALLDDLDWGLRTEAFEQAWSDLAWHLGMAGQRPERDTGRGPDCLWALPRQFLVCEAKSNARHDHPVYKDDAKQLSNAMDWFRAEYSASDGIPVLIHPQAVFDRRAAVPSGCRVVTIKKLATLRGAVDRLAAQLADTDAFRDPTRVSKLLQFDGLTTEAFVIRYTVAARARA